MYAALNVTCTMASTYFNLILTLSLFHLTVGSLLCPIDYIYQLGDSLADTGNLIRVLPFGPFLPAANPPYGRTFPGTPTGRWSDGRLIIDYLATALGLPLLNPYLATNASFANGVNFAVAGSTALGIPFLAMQGIIVPPITTPLGGQLQQFQTYLNSSCGSTPGGCERTLQRALVLVGEIGGNDINYGLSQGRSLEDLRTLVPLITDAIVNATREVIRLGAVRVVVPGNFPIGCFPTNLNMFNSSDPTAYDSQGCLRRLNELVVFQNNNLQRALALLRLEFPSAIIISLDYYNAFQTVLRAGPELGFNQSTLLKACCGNGTLGTCGSTATVCSNPAGYISWDGLHLTQEAYRRISSLLILELRAKIQCIKSSG